MTLRIQIVVIAVAALAIICTFVLIRKAMLGLKIMVPWFIVFILIIIFAAIPSFMEWVAHLLGIYDPVNMILFLAIVFLMIIIYSLTVALYDNHKRMRTLIQKVAYLEDEIKNK